MRISEIYQRLQQFVVAGTSLNDEQVIFSGQSGKKPYITVAASSFRSVALPLERSLGDSGEMNTTFSMVFTASFQAFSNTPYQAEDLLSDLYLKFYTDLQSNIFKADMAKQRTLKPVTAIPVVLGQQIESRAILEVEIACLKSTTDQVGLIKSVEIDANINNRTIHLRG